MLTPYQKRQKDEDFMASIYTSDDFRSKKNSRKKKVNFQNKMCVSSQYKRVRKEEGATATASHLPSLSWLSSGRTGSVLPWKPSAFSRKAPLTTDNVLLTKRRRFSVI